MSNFQNIIYEQDARGIVRITLNRPDKLNALSPDLVKELNQAVAQVAEDDSAKLLIVTGSGRAWSAGVDLEALNSSIKGGQFEADQILADGKEFIERLQAMPKVAIAMVNGFCFTGALEFMMAFDLIYAAEEAKIGDTHSKWGIAPKWGMSQRLAQLVGVLKAHEMSFTAQAVSGKEAAQIGLVNRAVPLEQLEDLVMKIAGQILDNSLQTVGAMKELYYKGHYGTLKEGLAYEYETTYTINDREEFLRDFKSNKKK